METPENQINPDITKKTEASSLLDQIIKTANDSSSPIAHDIPAGTSDNQTGTVVSGSTPPVKKPRDPMTAGMVMKLIGSLFIVAVIFFGSFLAYIVFNPEQAGFFVNMLGIDPKDVKNLLKSLINGSFGTIVLMLSMIFIISLFRAVWTPKEQKRRRLISWLSASIVGILLFGIILPFWAYLFKIINETPYDNPGGDVLIYDNDLYSHTESRNYARISNTQNLIGPITLKYDLSTNAKAISKKNLITIDSYTINFDKAKCITESAIITGSDPSTEEGLICTFDEIHNYKVIGTYTGRDRSGKITTIDIPLDTVEIKGLIDISTNTNTEGKKIRTINASKVKNLGNPRWRYNTTGSSDIAKSSITETISSKPILVCLVLFKNTCNRTFLITDNDDPETELNTGKGFISFERDPTNLLNVSMTLSGININKNEIVSIDWIMTDNFSICEGIQSTCEYTFSSYGIKVVTAKILLANKKNITIQGTISLNKPILIIRHAQVFDKDSKLLNTEETFDQKLGAYILKDIDIPARLTLDARDIVLENSGYKIKNIKWKISNNKTTEEKIGEKVDIDLLQTLRYTIEATYTFDKNLVNNETESFTARDLIIVDLARKPLEPMLTIQQSSDYAPAKVTVDASSSQSKNGSIQKFLFDFGEGKPQAEGDAIQIYEYKTSGEKKITLTIIDDNNEKATLSKYIILKDTPKSLVFTTSMSPAMVGIPVDLIADGATGDIEEWIWNFGDNTPIGKGYEISHTYNKIGSYTITLTVRYIDGTERSVSQNLKVEDMQ